MTRVLRIDKKLPDTWQDALRDFLFWKQGQGVALRTLEDYREHVTRFFNRYHDAWDPVILRQRVLEYMAQDIAPSTFNLRKAYLGGFFIRREARSQGYPLFPSPQFRNRNPQGRS